MFILVILEDEGHVLFDCPENAAARAAMLLALQQPTCQAVHTAMDNERKLMCIMSSQSHADWKALAQMAGRVRQRRRQRRRHFEQLNADMLRSSFPLRRDAWRADGRFACRHGVLFARRQRVQCACMMRNSASPQQWQHARWMPGLDHNLRAIVVKPFLLAEFRRIGELTAETRRLGW